jgi:hypothetical protein
VRHHVHADVHGTDHASKFDFGCRRQFGAATVLKVVEASASISSASSIGSNRACSCAGCSRANEVGRFDI